MYHSRLRVYYGPDDSSPIDTVKQPEASPHKVTVPASEIFAALADAIYNDRAWLRDFADEEITIPTDLYEVILAYEHMRRPSA